jgi:replicative DNA helicase
VIALARNGHRRRHDRDIKPPDATLPQNSEAEESVIGGILVHARKLAEVRPLLEPGDFYHPGCRIIYEAMGDLVELDKPVDALTVLEQLRASDREPLLSAFGGADYLTGLMEKLAPGGNIAYHAKIVRDKATARAIVIAAREIAAHGAGDYGDLDGFTATAQQKLTEAIARRQLDNAQPTVAATLRSEGFRTAQHTYPTCFADLNEKICGGVKARQLTVIAAPTGSGKTGFVGTLALDWAHQGTPVLWVCTEIDNEEQSARFASIDARSRDFHSTPDDYLSLRFNPEHAAKEFDGLPIYLLNLEENEGDPFPIIKARAEELTRSHGTPPIVILDYLQVLAVEDEDARRMSVTKVSTGLRKLAKQLNAAVVAISSVSRAYYGKNVAKKAEGEEEDPIDWLAAAKDSGDIEFSTAVFLYLDTDRQQDALGESSARIIIAKSRRGTRGFIGLRFHGPSGAFEAAPDSMTSSGHSKAQAADDKVLRFIHGPVYQPMPKRQLRQSVPRVRASSVDDAVERLIAGGHLKMDKTTVVDGMNRNRTVWVVAPATPAKGDSASRNGETHV